MTGQVCDLLGSAGAFDPPARHREQRGAAGGALNEVPGLGGKVDLVVRRDAVATQCLGHTGDTVPIELDAWADDQEVVADRTARRRTDRLLVGVDLGGGILDPGHALRDLLRLGTATLLGRRATPANERPQRLVVVRLGGVDDGDVLFTGPAEPGGDGDPRRSPPTMTILWRTPGMLISLCRDRQPASADSRIERTF